MSAEEIVRAEMTVWALPRNPSFVDVYSDFSYRTWI